MYDPIDNFKWTAIEIIIIFLIITVIGCAISYKPYKPKETQVQKESYVKCDRCGGFVKYNSIEGYFTATWNKCKKCYIEFAGEENFKNCWEREKERYMKDRQR